MITEQQVVMTSVLVVLVGLVAFTIGLWTGHGRDREYIADLEEELKQRQALGVMPQEIAHELFPAHADQALAVANEAPMWTYRAHNPANAGQIVHIPVLAPTEVITPENMSWTGEIQRMTEDFQRDMERLLGKTDQQLKEVTR